MDETNTAGSEPASTPAPAKAKRARATEGGTGGARKEASAKPAKKKAAKGKSKAKTNGHAEPGMRAIAGRSYDISDYERVKTPAGSVSFNNGDEVATKFHGKELNEIYEIVAKKLGVSDRSLKDKYRHLNAGMQRMSLGNRYRAALRQAAAK